MIENLDDVWYNYKKNNDPELKEKLILEYASLVKVVAGRLSMQVGQYVDYEDLISYGIFGLIDAIDKFDNKKGVKFETYASLRIRGEIIDNIRRMDWVPRTIRQKSKLFEQVFFSLESELGREPTDKEVADKLGISVEEAQGIIKKTVISSLISLDDYLDQNHEGTVFNIVNSNTDTPERSYEKKEVKNMLVEAINQLNEKEQRVVALYYFEELTLKEISKIMNFSNSF